MSEQAYKTPLVDLLRNVPKDHRTEWPIQWAESGAETGHALCPIGKLAHEAADRIAELEAAQAQVGEGEVVGWQYQHEDTGRTTFVTHAEVAAFEELNPRWHKTIPLYTAPPAVAINQQLLLDYIRDDLESITVDGWCCVDLDEDNQKLQVLESAGLLVRHPVEPDMIKIIAAAQETGK